MDPPFSLHLSPSSSSGFILFNANIITLKIVLYPLRLYFDLNLLLKRALDQVAFPRVICSHLPIASFAFDLYRNYVCQPR